MRGWRLSYSLAIRCQTVARSRGGTALSFQTEPCLAAALCRSFWLGRRALRGGEPVIARVRRRKPASRRAGIIWAGSTLRGEADFKMRAAASNCSVPPRAGDLCRHNWRSNTLRASLHENRRIRDSVVVLSAMTATGSLGKCPSVAAVHTDAARQGVFGSPDFVRWGPDRRRRRQDSAWHHRM